MTNTIWRRRDLNIKGERLHVANLQYIKTLINLILKGWKCVISDRKTINVCKGLGIGRTLLSPQAPKPFWFNPDLLRIDFRCHLFSQ